MRERYRVQELYLSQRVFWVDVEVEIHCTVKNNDQAEDHNFRAEAFNFLDQVDS